MLNGGMWKGRRSSVQTLRAVAGYAIAVGGPAVVSAGLLAVRDEAGTVNVALASLIPVVAAAAIGGLGPGVVASALGFLAFDLLFLPPYGHLKVHLWQDYVSLGAYLLIALVTSGLVSVRERRRVQAEQRERETRTALLRSVSHDLRTPLAAIKASVSSLLDGEVAWSGEQTREFLQTIDRETDRLTRLVHNLLDMSRIEAGALEPHLVAMPLTEVVAPAVRLARAKTEQPIRVEVPDSLPPVLVDPVRLDQVLTNLLDNARQYAAGSPVTVTARARGQRVELRVIDHGPGIPEAAREHVFDQFYRVRGNGRPEGTGMGLAICRGIVEALGGTIRAERTPGGGATFVISLPATGAVRRP